MSLMISVSGVRGLVGKTMTTELARDMGLAFGTFIDGGPVIVARDSRTSGPELLRALVDGLRRTGCSVTELGVATTPGTGNVIASRNARGGIVITASHNPVEWNGIKFLDENGSAPAPETARKIIAIYESRSFRRDEARPTEIDRDDSAGRLHLEKVLSLVPREAIADRKFAVVLDSINGAGCRSGRALLERLGCSVTHLNAEPTGDFAHPPEPIAENLTGLCDAVRSTRAAVGFAQDPDADRLAVVDETGRFIGEEYTVALAAELTFRHRPGTAAVNLATSRMIDDIAAQHPGCNVIRTAVGEANVVTAMRENHCVIGGEGNGGVIDPRVVHVRDSLISMALILQLLSECDRPLSRIVDRLPRYEMIKQKMPMSRDRIQEFLQAAKTNASDGTVNDCDGVRIDWPAGWALVRASNTEPIVRIFAEAATRPDAESLIERIRRAGAHLLDP